MFIKFILSQVLLYKLCFLSSSYAEDCSASSPNCVCAYHFLIEDLKGLILTSKGSHNIIYALSSYQCQQYRLLPSELTLEISQNSVPSQVYKEASSQSSPNRQSHEDKLIKSPHFGVNGHHPRRQKRQVAEESYKDDSISKLNRAIPKLPLNSAPHVYAFLGHRARMQCGPFNGQPTNPVFDWVHSDGKPISAPGLTINSESGELTIYASQLSDIGIYNCSLRNLNSPLKIVSSESHQLSVVTDPINWLSITAVYVTKECSMREMNSIQLALKDWISAYICPICTVHDASIICDDIDDGYNEYELTFALTAINVESDIETGVTPGSCSRECIIAVHLALLRIVQESLVKLLALPIHIGGHHRIRARKDAATFDAMTGCLAGFQFMYKLCFPCLRGRYSLRGETECVECTQGYYQPSMGASRCLPCDSGYNTVGMGAVSPWECIPKAAVGVYHAAETHKIIAIVLSVFFGLLLLILLVLLFLCCCFPNTKIGKCLRLHCLCGFCRPFCFKLMFWRKKQKNLDHNDVAKSKLARLKRRRDPPFSVKPLQQESKKGSKRETKEEKRGSQTIENEILKKQKRSSLVPVENYNQKWERVNVSQITQGIPLVGKLQRKLSKSSYASPTKAKHTSSSVKYSPLPVDNANTTETEMTEESVTDDDESEANSTIEKSPNEFKQETMELKGNSTEFSPQMELRDVSTYTAGRQHVETETENRDKDEKSRANQTSFETPVSTQTLLPIQRQMYTQKSIDTRTQSQLTVLPGTNERRRGGDQIELTEDEACAKCYRKSSRLPIVRVKETVAKINAVNQFQDNDRLKALKAQGSP